MGKSRTSPNQETAIREEENFPKSESLVNSSAIVMTDIFGTPWTPMLNGNELRPCALIEDFVTDNIQPDPRNKGERPWTIAGFREITNSVPDAEKALIESVVAIWRLQQHEEEGGKEDSLDSAGWQDHLEAWLVRRGRGLIGDGDCY